MVVPLLWLLPTVAFGQIQGTYTVSARLEAADRSPYEGIDALTAKHAVDIELFPLAETELFAPGALHMSAVYAPAFRMRELNAGPLEYEDGRTTPGRRFEHYHRVAWLAERRQEGAMRPYVRQAFSYGRMDLLAAFMGTPALPGVPLTPRPVPSQNVNTFSLTDVLLETEAGVEIPLSRYWVATAFAGYAWGGGLNAEARAVLPMARSPFLGAQTQWQMSSSDTLILRLAARYSFFLSNHAEAGTVDLYETWRHAFDENTSVELSAGASAYGGRPIPTNPENPGTLLEQKSPFQWHAAPYVALRFFHHLEWGTHNVDVDANAQIAPFLDRYTASAYERVEASIGLRWRWEELYANARGGLGKGLGHIERQLSMTAYFAEAALGYRINPYLRTEFRGSYASLPQMVATELAPELIRMGRWRVALSLTVEYAGSY